jgi:DNA-binding transcriptional MocR family regulator
MRQLFYCMGTNWKVKQDEFIRACEKTPKYKALANLIEQAVRSGDLQTNEKLPAQRWLADALTVTHGTVTRAYELAEKRGLLTAKLGAGTYVNALNQPAPLVTGQKVYDFASSMQPMLGQQTVLAKALQELALDPQALVGVMTYAHQGLLKHKMAFSRWLAQANRVIKVAPHDLIFTQGAQQGIFTCLQILCDSGDHVMHEALAYPGFFKAAKANKVTTLALDLNTQGIDLSQLEAYCESHQPKLLYLTANIQNPTNIQYSDEQRSRILTLSKRYGFYIIEDDVNYTLPENWQSPLQQEAPEQVFYLSSLSKYVAGGLRVAYAIIPKIWQARFNQNLHSQCWMNASMSLEIASRFLFTEHFEHNQAQLAQEMRYRQNAMTCLLHRCGFEARSGGLNVWLSLPLSLNMHALNAHLLEQNIKVRTADLFTDQSQAQVVQNGIRLSLGGFDLRADFDEGLAVLEKAILAFKQVQDVVI